MDKLLAHSLAALCVLAALFGAVSAFGDAEPDGPFVVICPIDGEINDGVAVLVRRALAEAEGAEALILRIDTPGGRVDSAIDIAGYLLEAPCPTIAYIEGMGAISAGALISFACDTMIMAPATNIGASMPIMMGVEASEDMNEKSMSFIRAKYRALGEEKGHNPLLGEAMVDRAVEIRGIKGEDGAWQLFKMREGSPPETYQSAGIMGAVFEVLEEVTGEDLGKVKETVERAMGQPAAPKGNADGGEADGEGEAQEAVLTTNIPADLDLSQAQVISPAGKLLTMTGSEALEYGLIAANVSSLDDALEYLGYAEMRRHEIVPTWEEIIFAWLTAPTIAGLLLMVGIGGIITEVRTPGFGVAGIVGIVALFLFFGAHLVLGIADWIAILLVLTGLILIGVEIFVLPGFGVAGVGGIGCVLMGVYLSLTKVTIPEYHWDFVRLQDVGQTFATAAVAATVFGLLAWKLLPKTPLPALLTLDDVQLQEAGYTVQTAEEEALWMGNEGITTSALRPAGRGRFDNKTLDIVTRGEFLEKGTPVKVIEVKGNRLVVTATEEVPEV